MRVRTSLLVALLLVGGLLFVREFSPDVTAGPPAASQPPAESAEPDSDELMRELMERARKNGGRIELGPNDPLGRKLLERMEQGGNPFPFDFGDGFPFGDDDGFFGPMPDEMRRMFEQRPPGGSFHLEGPQIERVVPSENEKRHAAVLGQYQDVVAQAAKSTVEVRCDDEPVALGTIVDTEGHVLTKASELNGAIACRTANGKSLPAKLVAMHKEYDVALLSVDGKNLTPVRWSAAAPALGGMLATPGADGQAVSIGVVSVAARKPIEARGFLGIGHEATDEGVQITEVVANSSAHTAGLQVGDIVVQVDGQPIDSGPQLAELVGRHDPGEQVKLRISRGGKQRDVAATLGTREMAGHRVMRFNTLNQMGGPLSERRDGFPYVLEHDSVLRPNECGGPLVDLTGEAVGVNIARAGRVNSYAIPAATVQELIVALKSGRHAPDAELARATSPADGTARPDAAQRAEHIKRLEQESQRLNRQLEQLMRQLDQLRDE